MGLRACEQRILDGIESRLRAAEPGLTGMFAVFTRLTRDDGAPATEMLPPVTGRWERLRSPRPGRWRSAVLATLLFSLALLVAGVSLGTNGRPPACAASTPAGATRAVQAGAHVGIAAPRAPLCRTVPPPAGK